MKLFGFAMMLLIGIVCSEPLLAQSAKVIHFDQLSSMLERQNDTTYIFNFFATWCEPCVEEFPFFQQFSSEHRGEKVRVIFVSLDFKKAFRTHLLPFLKKHKVKNETVLLDAPDYNSWIDKVDSSWDGNLPATLIVNNARHERTIFPKEFTLRELEAAAKPYLN
ncbi:MAG TPA: TlpA family protein disulfide reductase [Candidatus Kapabacteria bacterium]